MCSQITISSGELAPPYRYSNQNKKEQIQKTPTSNCSYMTHGIGFRRILTGLLPIQNLFPVEFLVSQSLVCLITIPI